MLQDSWCHVTQASLFGSHKAQDWLIFFNDHSLKMPSALSMFAALLSGLSPWLSKGEQSLLQAGKPASKAPPSIFPLAMGSKKFKHHSVHQNNCQLAL